jgi:hypothetical protein
MNDKTTSKSKDTANEIKQQAKSVGDKLLAFASKKFHVDFEIYGWAIALAALILLLILIN